MMCMIEFTYFNLFYLLSLSIFTRYSILQLLSSVFMLLSFYNVCTNLHFPHHQLNDTQCMQFYTKSHYGQLLHTGTCMLSFLFSGLPGKELFSCCILASNFKETFLNKWTISPEQFPLVVGRASVSPFPHKHLTVDTSFLPQVAFLPAPWMGPFITFSVDPNEKLAFSFIVIPVM